MKKLLRNASVLFFRRREREREREEYEIIIVDDGSTDNSVKIIQSLIQNKDNCLLLRQENAGAGVARNNALQHARGEYIVFIDSDDYIENNFFNVIFSEIRKHPEIEILQFAYKRYNEDMGIFEKMPNRDAVVYNNTVILDRIFSFSEYPQIIECIQYPWNKIYKSKIIKDNNIKFPAILLQEDMVFTIAYLINARYIKVIKDILYIHVINRKDGQATQIADSRRLDAIIAFNQCDAFFKNKNFSDSQILAYLAFKFNLIEGIISFTKGTVQARFILYLYTCLKSLSSSTICQLMCHRLVNNNLKQMMQKDIFEGRELLENEEKRLLLSIIIPVYNVEPWLRQCLQSVASQTLKSNLFEVIIVDDKSTDGSIDISREFCEKYSNFHLIELPENTPGGAGIPSNIGIEQAKGLYIGFVDSDDFIEPEMFELLLGNALKNKTDVSICNYTNYIQENQSLIKSYDFSRWKSLNTNFNMKPLRVIQSEALGLIVVPWRKIYRREFLNSFQIRYPEGDFFFEDTVLHWYALINTQKISVVDMPLIYHRLGRAGQTEMADRKKWLTVLGIHGRTIKNYLLKYKKFNEYKIEFYTWITDNSEWMLQNIVKYRKELINDIQALFKGATFTDLLKLKKVLHKRADFLIFYYLLLQYGNYSVAQFFRRFIRLTIKIIDKLRKVKRHLLS